MVAFVGSNSRSTSTTASPTSLVYPQGIVAGDIAMLALTYSAGAATVITTPTGWTFVTEYDQAVGGSMQVRTFTRVCDGTETGTSVTVAWTGGGSEKVSLSIGVWRGASFGNYAFRSEPTTTSATAGVPAVGVASPAAWGTLWTERGANPSTSLTPPSGLTLPGKTPAQFSDDFNRADGSMGSNWITVGVSGPPTISGNLVIGGNSAQQGIRYTTPCDLDDQFSQVTWKSGGLFNGVAVGMPAFVSGSGAAQAPFWYVFRRESATTISIGTKQASTSSYVNLSGNITYSMADGDVMRLEWLDGVLTGYVNGVSKVTFTPTGTNIIPSGQRCVGMALFSTSTAGLPIYDDWSGGSLTQGSSFGTGSGSTSSAIAYSNTVETDGSVGAGSWTRSTSLASNQVVLTYALIDTSRTRVQKTHAISWDVAIALTRVQKTQVVSWNVRSRIQKTQVASWDVRTRLQDLNSVSWDVRARVQDLNPVSWDVRARVQKTQVASWNVRTRLTKTTQVVSWNQRLRLSKTQVASWDVAANLATTRVQKTHVISWSQRARLVKTNVVLFDVRQRIQRTQVASWNVRTRLTKTTQVVSWNVRTRFSKTQVVSWNQRARLSKTQSVLFDVRVRVQDLNPISWNVRAHLVKSHNVSWNVFAFSTSISVIQDNAKVQPTLYVIVGGIKLVPTSVSVIMNGAKHPVSF